MGFLHRDIKPSSIPPPNSATPGREKARENYSSRWHPLCTFMIICQLRTFRIFFLTSMAIALAMACARVRLLDADKEVDNAYNLRHRGAARA